MYFYFYFSLIAGVRPPWWAVDLRRLVRQWGRRAGRPGGWIHTEAVRPPRYETAGAHKLSPSKSQRGGGGGGGGDEFCRVQEQNNKGRKDFTRTLKDSPGAKGKKERVVSGLPHFPADRALRWTALSGKLTFNWSPTSPSVSSSRGALDRISSMLNKHTRQIRNTQTWCWILNNWRAVVKYNKVHSLNYSIWRWFYFFSTKFNRKTLQWLEKQPLWRHHYNSDSLLLH